MRFQDRRQDTAEFLTAEVVMYVLYSNVYTLCLGII